MNFNDYEQFVVGKTSDPSKDMNVLIARLQELDQTPGVNFAALDTGITGLACEAGEGLEILKKIKFQGKPLDEDTIFHIKRELGDVCFYFALTCWSLGFSIEEILEENVRKLDKRYAGGGFTVQESEVRQTGDL